MGCYGDGGAIFTDDDELAQKMISIRSHGSGTDKYDNITKGLNGRLDTIQAAVLLEKLVIFENELYNRNKVAKYYQAHISDKFQKPYVPKNYVSSWAQYSLLTNSKKDRDRKIIQLKKKEFQQ